MDNNLGVLDDMDVVGDTLDAYVDDDAGLAR
jgi:hypothetical protein